MHDVDFLEKTQCKEKLVCISSDGLDVETDILSKALHNIPKVHARGIFVKYPRLESKPPTSWTQTQGKGVRDVQKFSPAGQCASCLLDQPVSACSISALPSDQHDA
jgi:hypothetical protein